MRLEQYINEAQADDDKLVEMIRKDCSQWFTEMGDRRVWRGTKTKLKGVEKRFPRQDRRPLDTPKEVHDVLDDMFKKKFGWKARSQGVFAANSTGLAGAFGSNTYLVYPCNGYKYIYNEKVDDLTERLQDTDTFLITQRNSKFEPAPNWHDEEKRNEILKKIIGTYTNKNLVKAKNWVEVMIDCPNGYWIIGDGTFFSDNYFDLLDGYIN